MTWHYRVVRHPDGSLALHEVYCDEAGVPNGCTASPVSFAVDAEEGLERLVQSLHMALDDATHRSVIDLADFASEKTADSDEAGRSS